MKALSQAAVFVVFCVVGGIVGVVLWLGWEIGTRMLDALDSIGPVLFTAGAVVTFGVFAIVAVGGAIAFVRAVNLRSRAVHHRDGLYPLQYHHVSGQAQYIDMNAPNSQALAVMHMHRGARAGAASVQRVLDAHPAQPELAAPQPLSVDDIVGVDLRVSPHWLLVGSTGSGKSTASFRILGDIARRVPAQFIITEPGGVGWGAAASATNTLDIARTIANVHAELERRQELLRAADVQHVQDLPQPLGYIVLVAEETETVLDDLRLQDKALRDATIVALRGIARLGRKCGIVLVAITQAGTTDVFDAHVRKNITNTLLFRSEHTVPEMWRLRGVRLSDLPPGTAYSVRHSSFVSFPRVARPSLPLLANPLQPAQPDGGILVDWPTTGRLDAVGAVVDGCTPILQPGREPDATTAAELRRLYADGWSKTRLCVSTWGYKDGQVWRYLEQALNGEL